MIGIAIPAYRAARTLEATLRSCIRQTFSDWVAYVTVEGRDGSEEQRIASELGDRRIHVAINGDLLGQSANFNRAMMQCRAAGAQWIKLLCADDILRDDALERMLDVGESTDRCGLVFGYYDSIDEQGATLTRVDLSRVRTRVIPGREYIRLAVPLHNPNGGPSSVMIRADVLERAGCFDGQLNYMGDVDYWYRIGEQFDVAVLGQTPILDYRMHSNSVTGRGAKSSAHFEQAIDVMRRIAARQPPFSSTWWAAQACIGRTVASHCVTALASLRRGDFRLGLTAVGTSLRRLSPVAAPVAAWDLPVRLVRLALGLPFKHELVPPVSMHRRRTTGPATQ